MIKAFKYAAYAATLMLLALPGCGAGDFASEYAIARHDLPGGKAIYFKREVRGVNGSYDVVAISPNGDPCASVNGETDYCICTAHEHVYYKLEGDTLHLYDATANSAPARQGFPVKVVNHEIHPMDAEEFRRTFAARGINRLDLTIDGTKKCG